MTERDPQRWAQSWLPTNEDPARPLMTLATTGRSGGPAARTVLLSETTETGFAFHTDARSDKVAEIAADPRVCLTLVIPESSRQLVVSGLATEQPTERSRQAFGRRSAYLRQLAWLNDAELARLGDVDRRQRWEAAVASLPEGPLDPPPTWVGFDVTPLRYVFWEGGMDVASRRTEFRRVDAGWATQHLPG